MAQRIAHRGPDSEGYWADDEVGIRLAHRRLAILDLTSAGSQPMVSGSGRNVLVFNGEIYNCGELRTALEAAGQAPNWRGHSDTEVLLACVDAWGIETALKRCIGMFAFAVWDRHRRALILARDRMGEKPLYYGRISKSLVFGSELKVLKAHPDFAAKIDTSALALLLRHNYIPAPYSIYRDFFKLPAGSWVEFADPSDVLKPPSQYWSFSEIAEAGECESLQLTDAEASDELNRLLLEVVRSQMISDVPLGAWLSGGVDSSTVVALMQAQSKRPIRTFSIGFENSTFDESGYARVVARHLGTDHTEMRLTDHDTLNVVPELGHTFDEPFADSSQIPTALLARLTRKQVTVAMSGDGGDEIFGGYNRYILGPQLWSKISLFPEPLRQLTGLLLERTPAGFTYYVQHCLNALGIWPGLAEKLPRIGRKLRQVRSIDDLYIRLVNVWENPLPVLRDSAPRTLLENRSAWPRLRAPAARMMALDALTYLPDDILVKVDRCAMAASLETRAPFLDARTVEFVGKLPLNMKISRGVSKKILRQVLYRYVPPQLIERPKQGFSVPLDDWLRGPLRDWAEDLLSETRLRSDSFFDHTSIRRLWSAHLQGQHRFGYRLWSILMFQSWLVAQR